MKIHEQFVSDVLARKQLKFKDVRLAMMSLPEKLRGYREVIRTKHGTLSDVKDKTELFFLLNYCFSFIDIELLNHCIDKWGTDGLKKRMKKYEKKLEQFMEQTTVRRLIKYLPGHRGPPEGRKSLEDALPGAAIDWKLSKIDKRRKRRCAKLQLSEIVSCLIGMNQYDIKEDCSIGSANHNSEHVDTDIDKKIEEFDKQKTALIEKILSELQQSVDFRPAHLLQALAVLPLRLRKQYNGEQLYSEVCKLQQKDVDGVFWTLCFGPLVDYYLLEYIVLKFGSPDLKKEMDLYSGGIQDFMKHTTVKQLLSSSWHVPAEDCGSKLPELVREMLDNCDPEVTFLKQLDTLQRRCGSNAKLSVLVDYAVLIHYDRDSDSESYTSDSEASC